MVPRTARPLVNRARAMVRRTRAPSPIGLSAGCASCELRELCSASESHEVDLHRLAQLISNPVSVPRGSHLYRTNDPFAALYAVNAGCFKTCSALENGHEHVSGFHMVGELLGFDGIGLGVHTCDAIALEDSLVCVIDYHELEALAQDFPRLQRQMLQLMGREIVHNHGVMLKLSSMRSDVRIAAFLLNLAARLKAHGVCATDLRLTMTRAEIGMHLGLTVETVSRCLSHFSELGLLQVRGRRISILDVRALKRMVKSVSLLAAAGGAGLQPSVLLSSGRKPAT